MEFFKLFLGNLIDNCIDGLTAIGITLCLLMVIFIIPIASALYFMELGIIGMIIWVILAIFYVNLLITLNEWDDKVERERRR